MGLVDLLRGNLFKTERSMHSKAAQGHHAAALRATDPPRDFGAPSYAMRHCRPASARACHALPLELPTHSQLILAPNSITCLPGPTPVLGREAFRLLKPLPHLKPFFSPDCTLPPARQALHRPRWVHTWMLPRFLCPRRSSPLPPPFLLGTPLAPFLARHASAVHDGSCRPD
jgi:hypothetical protein